LLTDLYCCIWEL